MHFANIKRPKSEPALKRLGCLCHPSNSVLRKMPASYLVVASTAEQDYRARIVYAGVGKGRDNVLILADCNAADDTPEPTPLPYLSLDRSGNTAREAMAILVCH